MEVRNQLYTPGTLPPAKESHYPLHKRLVGPRVNLDAFVEEKNLLPVPGIEPCFVHDIAYLLY